MTKRRVVKQELLPPERGPDPNPSQELLPPQNSVATQLASQHPVHGVFGEVFEDLGGKERLTEWAEENYTKFIQILTKMSPSPQPTGGSGQINIQINNNLGPSPLDE